MKKLCLLLFLFCISACKEDSLEQFQVDGSHLTEIYFDQDKVYSFDYYADGTLKTESSKNTFRQYTYSSGEKSVKMDVFLDEGGA